MRARRMVGGMRRAVAAAAALLAGTVGLAVGTAQPASAEAPNMVFHLFDDNVPWGYNGPFAQVIFDRNLDGGTVTWFADNVPMPECTTTVTPDDLVYGCWPRKQLEPGDYTIRIDYSGSATFDPVSTPGGTLRIHQQATTITAIGPTSVDAGAATEVSATLLGDEPGANGPVVGATLTFSVPGSTCDAATDADGTARCTLTAPSAPTTLSIVYAGDSRHRNSAALSSLTLNAVPTTTTVSVVPDSAFWGTSAAATATISPTPSGGTVEFRTPAGLLPLCSAVPVTGATATCSFATPNGATTITATYSGSGTHEASSGNAAFTGLKHVTALDIVGHDPLMVGTESEVDVQLDDTVTGSGAPANESVTISLGSASCVATTGPFGAASCTLTPTAVASTLTATFDGTDEFSASTATEAVTVAKAPTVLTLSSPPTDFGAPLTITATVSAADGGTIDFRTGGESIGGCEARPVTLAGGLWQATCTTSTFQLGTFPVTGVYSGTANYAGSTSQPHDVSITPAATTLTYTGDTTATVGIEPTGRAVLRSTATNAGIPDQPVSFTWATGSCGATTDIDGVATCRLYAPDRGGPADLSVSYGEAADERFLGSSTTATISVAKAATTTTVQVPPTAAFGEFATLTAVIAPSGVEGTVTFTADGGLIGGCDAAVPTVTALGYVATCNTPNLWTGEHLITAIFSGNHGYEPSTAPAQPLTVLPGPTALEYTGDTTGTVGSPVTLRARLTRNGNAPATGPLVGHAVTFAGAVGTCSDVTDESGVAACTITPDEVADGGTITMTFAATTEYQASAASSVLTVNRAPTSTLLQSPSDAQFGEPVLLSVVVTPTNGDGTVTFRAAPSGDPGAAAAIAGCTDVALALVGADWTATCTTSALPAGALAITAEYSGDSDYLGSTGTTATAITPAWTTLAYTGASSGTVATPLALAATLTAQPGGPPSGTFIPDLSYSMALASAGPVTGVPLTFTLGDLACTAVTDAAGVASCTVTPTSVAQAGTVQVTFAGTAQYASSHAAAGVAIAPAATIVTLSTPATVGFSLPVQLVATVAPAPIGGTVAFTDDGAPIAGCTAVAVGTDGAARCTMPAATLGAHHVIATFGGTDSYLASASAPSTVTVVPATSALTYQGPATAIIGVPITVSATLTVTGPSAPAPASASFARSALLAAPGGPVAFGVAGQELTFRLGSAACTGTTDASGTASCVLTPPDTAGDATLLIEFAGSVGYQASSIQLGLSINAAPMLPATGSDTSTRLALAAALLAAGLAATRLRRRRA
jgi:LPXTG-motif cell wall-anchored protein